MGGLFWAALIDCLRMNPLRAILFKLTAVTLFVVMSSLIKVAADHVPPGEAVFFRSFFALPVIVVWQLMAGTLRDGLKVKSPGGHFLRGVLGTLAMACFFTSLGLLPLPEVTALGYATPILIVVFAALLLKEPVRLFRIAAVTLGLVGVLVMLSPHLSVLSDGPKGHIGQAFGAAIALVGALMAALAQVTIRKLTMTERTSAIVFWFTITSTVLSLLTLPFGWTWPPVRIFACLVCAGLVGGVAQIMLTLSYRWAHASVVAPFDYASMLLALVIGLAMFFSLL